MGSVRHTPSRPALTAINQLWSTIHDRLRHVAAHLLARERRNHTLQPTALVHEAWLRLVGDNAVPQQSASMLYRTVACSMRRVLVDHARGVTRQKRQIPGPREDAEQVAIMPVDPALLLDVEAALQKLAQSSPERAEVVNLRFFGCLTEEEVATALGISRRKVQMCMKSASAYLRAILSEPSEPTTGSTSATP